MTQGLPLPIFRLALAGWFHECSLQGLLMQHDAPYSQVELFHQLAQSVSCVKHFLQSLLLVQEHLHSSLTASRRPLPRCS